MDHQAFAQLLGSYGEFLGSIAVFATLAYLAVQVRQNTRSTQSQVLLQTTQLFQGVILAPSRSTALQTAIVGNREGRELGPEELVALGEYLYAYMHGLMTTALQFELGGLSIAPHLREGYLDDVRSFLATPNLKRVVQGYDQLRGGDTLERVYSGLRLLVDGAKTEQAVARLKRAQ